MECWLLEIKNQKAQEFCSPGQVEISNLLATPEHNKENKAVHKN